MGNFSHKVFKVVLNKISQALSIFGQYGSGVSYFVPGPVKFAEVEGLL